MRAWDGFRRAAASSLAVGILVTGSVILGCVSPAEERRRADRMETLLRTVAFPPQEPLGAYVSEVGTRLVEALGLEPGALRFYLIGGGPANAHSMANGAVWLRLDMLLMLNSDDELAMLLGHEIGHVQERHGLGRVNREGWIKAVTFLPLLPFNIVSGNVYGEHAVKAALTAFSREEEREADDLGFEAVRRAGYDLRCGVELYRTLDRVREIAQMEDPGLELPAGIWSTHPEPRERYERLSAVLGPEEAAERDAADRACGSEIFDRLDGLEQGATPPAAVVKDDGTILFLKLQVQVAASEQHGAHYRAGWLELAGLTHGSTLRRVDPGETLETADSLVRSMQSDREPIFVDRAPLRGRRSLQVAWPGRADTFEYRHWFELEGQTFRVSAELPRRRWSDARPRLRALAEHVEPLDIREVPPGLLPVRVTIHTAEEGDTLGTLVEGLPESMARVLSLWNAVEPDRELRPGTRVKLVERYFPGVE